MTLASWVLLTSARSIMSAVAAAGGGAGMPAWLLIGLVAVVAAVLVGGLIRSRSRVDPEWKRQVDDAAGRADWLAATLVPSLLKASTADEFEHLWFGGRAEAAELERMLFEVTRDAPDEAHRQYASLLYDAVRKLIEALDTERRLPRDDAAALRASQAGVEARREDVQRALHGKVSARAGVPAGRA